MNSIETCPSLYRRDGSGRLRTWAVEREGARYRTVVGLVGGKTLASGWIECGATTREEIGAKVEVEIERLYRYHLSRHYHRSIEEVDQPRFFSPMLAGRYETFARGYAQPKLDGIRCIAKAKGLFTRQGRPIVSAPHIVEALKPLFAAQPTAVLDGELYHHDLRHDFHEIMRLVRCRDLDEARRAQSAAMVQYHAYDLPSAATASFGERWSRLCELLTPTGELKLVATERVCSAAQYDDAHAVWLAAGYEGSMWRANAPYERARSKHLLKRKPVQDAEFECLAIEPGRGAAADRAVRAICRTAQGEIFAAGIRGDHAFARGLLGPTYRLVTVEYLHLTPRGVPRFPVATKFWDHQC